MSNPFEKPSHGKSIDTAPRDGTLIMVGDPEVGRFLMKWNPNATNGLFPGAVGFWETPNGSMTWSEHNDCGPTYWYEPEVDFTNVEFLPAHRKS